MGATILLTLKPFHNLLLSNYVSPKEQRILATIYQKSYIIDKSLEYCLCHQWVILVTQKKVYLFVTFSLNSMSILFILHSFQFLHNVM